MSKTTQYATINNKVSKDLGVVSIKYVQSLFHTCITWPKKSNLDLKVASIHRLCLCIIELIFLFHFHCGFQAKGQRNGGDLV
jgi:hypothetical protein